MPEYVAEGMRNTRWLIRFAESGKPINFIRIRYLAESLSLTRLMTNEQHLVPEPNDIYLLTGSHDRAPQNLEDTRWQLLKSVRLRFAKEPCNKKKKTDHNGKRKKHGHGSGPSALGFIYATARFFDSRFEL
jgi:hypothetical protein